MKSLLQFINEWKEDLGSQVIMIMGTPGCGKTYWMDHFSRKFFRTQGFTLNGKELDIDHTLKFFQIIDFPKFCERVINYDNTTIVNRGNWKSPHNKNKAWKMFIDNEQKRYTELNKSNGGLETNIPKLENIDYNFVAPWITRYENAKEDMKEKVFNEFERAMYNEYFNKVFASDFSVRNLARDEYDESLVRKIIGKSDLYIAISGAKFKHIANIAELCKQNNSTCRIVFLNGSLDKAIYQDSKRERSGGKDFVTDYAHKIDDVWNKIINPESEEYYKKHNIYCIYEFEDIQSKDINAYPAWKLKKIYK